MLFATLPRLVGQDFSRGFVDSVRYAGLFESVFNLLRKFLLVRHFLGHGLAVTSGFHELRQKFSEFMVLRCLLRQPEFGSFRRYKFDVLIESPLKLCSKQTVTLNYVQQF